MENELSKSLKKDTKIVSNARFNKSKRLEKRSWWSLFSISLLSISLICITIFENFFKILKIKPFLFFDYEIQTWIFTVLTSISILAISIALSSSRLDVEYEKLQDSALKINALSRRLETADDENYENHIKEYMEILDRNRINHDDIDFYLSKSIINKNTGIYYHFCNLFVVRLSYLPYYAITYISVSTLFSLLNSCVI